MSMDIGTFIHVERKKAKMTLKQLGKSTGISESYISRVETGGRQKPSAEVLIKIADVLDISSFNILTIAGYLPQEEEKKTFILEVRETKLNNLHPLELLKAMTPDVLLNSFFDLVKKLRLLYHDDLINLNLKGLKEEVTSKEIIDLVVVKNRELLHVYIFIVAMADYVGTKISADLIWKFVKDPQDKTVYKKIEDDLGFDAFLIWYRHYFTKDILSDYGDYKLSNPDTHTFDISSILKTDTLLVNGKILKPKATKSIKALLQSLE
jgi:transcriptional regulator with XRE-family HTH domain